MDRPASACRTCKMHFSLSIPQLRGWPASQPCNPDAASRIAPSHPVRNMWKEEMSCNVLVVEDEIFVAIEIESVVQDLGHRPVGIAADSRRALELAKDAELAFVDLNLVDGPTGIDLGRRLAGDGLTVLYMTANPSQLGRGV